DLAACVLGEPEVAVGAGRNTEGLAVLRRNVILSEEDTIGADSSDTVAVVLGEPNIPVRTRRDGDRPAVGIREIEPRDSAVSGDPANPAKTGREPDVPIGPHGQAMRSTVLAQRELGDLTIRADPANLFAVVLGEPEIPVRARNDSAGPTI